MTKIGAEEAARRRPFWRWLPAVLLALAAVAFFAAGLHRFLSVDTLREHRVELLVWVELHAVLAAVLFIAVYAIAIVLLPPSGTLMTVTGGFVFGAVVGTGLAVVGATAGATLLFLAARFALGDWLRRRAGPGIRRMRAGFRENELSYMLVLRLVPLFPFWLVNLAPAFLGVRLRTFVVGTVFGIIPGTAVFAVFGAGLGSILDADRDLSLAGVLTPEIAAALIGLALLALVPVAYKKIKARAA
ncbi:MAG: TVP38/TMEM64 family protein [Rhodospirillales bacterium]|nr:TVP38/TMEM64 family protein [Rhodospirillales bacterium]